MAKGRYSELKEKAIMVYLPAIMAFLIALAVYRVTFDAVAFLVTMIVFLIIFLLVGNFLNNDW